MSENIVKFRTITVNVNTQADSYCERITFSLQVKTDHIKEVYLQIQVIIN